MHAAQPDATVALTPTAAQHGIWLGQQCMPDSPAYWTAEAVELRGALDPVRFEHALRTEVAACDALHARYAADGASLRVDEVRSWPYARMDVSDAPCPWTAAHEWMRDDRSCRADLVDGPLFASALLRLAPDRHLWHLRAHHIALDGYGYALLIRRVAERYAASVAGRDLPETRWALDAVIAEDRAYRASSAHADDRRYWTSKLADAASPTWLAGRFPSSGGIRRLRGSVDADTFARWQSAAASAGTDWSTWVLAAVVAWIHRSTGKTDLTLGLPSMARLGSAAVAIPCMAMNIAPLRVRTDPAQRFTDLVVQISAERSASRPHQRCRYEDVKRDLGRTGSAQRLFGPIVNLMPFDPPRRFGDLDMTLHPLAAGPVEDIAVTIGLRAGGLRLDVECDPDACGDDALRDHRDRLLALLEAVATQPDATLSALPGAPRRTLRPSIIEGPPLPAPPTLSERLLALTTSTSQRHAIEQDGRAPLRYAGLGLDVRRFAARLVAHGVAPGDRIALLLPRAPDAIVAMLAVLYAGAAYVPLDPDGPPERIATVLDDACPALIVTRRGCTVDTRCAPVLTIGEDDDRAALDVPVAVGEETPAYVIYTSGSTGRPNGVVVSRRALTRFVASAGLRYGVRSDDRVLQFAPLQFDASVEEIFVALCREATLVLRIDAMLESVPRFVADCARLAISVLDLPTAFWHELAWCIDGVSLRLPDCVRLVVIGGEAALAERVERWHAAAQHARLVNTYGPTEATVVCTAATLDGRGAPIGTPLPGVVAYVVDDALDPVAVGDMGELCIGGDALSSGYLHRDALTARRFVAIAGARVYRTGDAARLDDDGVLHYVGRLDDEIKLSGHRIDPAEVETALLQQPGIRDAAVVACGRRDGGTRLVAFAVADGDPPPVVELRRALLARLAAPAVPSAYEWLPRLPRDGSGKIDRKALRTRPVESSVDPVAATALERIVIDVWADVLGADAIAPDADFFALGGNSLQALQVAHRLQRALSQDVSAAMLFRHGTVAAFAQALTAASAAPIDQTPLDPVFTLQRGSLPALFCLPPADGTSWCYLGLARHLEGISIVGLQAPGLTGTPPDTFDALIDGYLARIRAVQPHGPYRLLGWSSGGGIAHALACALQRAGDTVSLLAMLDAYPADIWVGKPEPTLEDALVALLDDLDASPAGADGARLSVDALLQKLRAPGSSMAAFDEPDLLRMAGTALHSMRMYRTARHPLYAGDVLFFRAQQRVADAPEWTRWQPYVAGDIDIVDVACNHLGMCQPASFDTIGPVLRARLEP